MYFLFMAFFYPEDTRAEFLARDRYVGWARSTGQKLSQGDPSGSELMRLIGKEGSGERFDRQDHLHWRSIARY